MASNSIIDAHIHLWPKNMADEAGHSWMTLGMPLAKEHVLADYYQASPQGHVDGVVYVETDVRYAKPSGAVSEWAKNPLDEIRFLRNVVEGGYGERDSKMLKAIVAWAPMDQPPVVLEEWLRLAEEAAGQETWRRVKGFRFLLQSIHDEKKFVDVVSGSNFINNLKTLGRRGFSFDVGVDQQSGGVWQLEAFAKCMSASHQGVPEGSKVVFILNHLCKPEFQKDGAGYVRWRRAIESMSRCSTAYMKLSGAFSELPQAMGGTTNIAHHLKPWVSHVFACFSASRVMFGSDWPVCNLKGPRQEDSWVCWKDVVEFVLDDSEYHFTDQDRERVWKGTAMEAYQLE
ncbi:L-rhamnono-gamma-lactonase [Fulvia fulva]|uniref:L-rhamnono-gamma-lactonase n=1 Tax=Passalora fulva TaxID=5499 RepID=A0A9Q8UU80_PASFU|nr:L-rhamnono-gamma-lactonase [Fulvia fulva]KAK4627257.1 L-rhamnono-gamma-lactonase [Fulvia fulva]KAK4627502.1 L-rhamnono-gamma-lactonase [Fulvia fulva]UJO22613.1 L-rhamnono-gamma-lactonase [Fulvia fulva]WPV13872.1 L-rhamnono-gamma-lactonase [Fulvia fulva]WPV28629.1 L-rhamnono-gamma-lactonase [Fulvia fulva]